MCGSFCLKYHPLVELVSLLDYHVFGWRRCVGLKLCNMIFHEKGEIQIQILEFKIPGTFFTDDFCKNHLIWLLWESIAALLV